jgi:hypothetical protein
LNNTKAIRGKKEKYRGISWCGLVGTNQLFF